MKREKTLTIAEYELPVIIESQTDGGYVARCPKWRDCFAQGDSIEEVLNEISLVASSLVGLYEEEELVVPLTLKKTSKKLAAHLSFTMPLVIAS